MLQCSSIWATILRPPVGGPFCTPSAICAITAPTQSPPRPNPQPILHRRQERHQHPHMIRRRARHRASATCRGPSRPDRGGEHRCRSACSVAPLRKITWPAPGCGARVRGLPDAAGREVEGQLERTPARPSSVRNCRSKPLPRSSFRFHHSTHSRRGAAGASSVGRMDALHAAGRHRSAQWHLIAGTARIGMAARENRQPAILVMQLIGHETADILAEVGLAELDGWTARRAPNVTVTNRVAPLEKGAAQPPATHSPDTVLGQKGGEVVGQFGLGQRRIAVEQQP